MKILSLSRKHMTIKEIAFTIYAVTDIKRSREFYQNVLGLAPSPDFADSEFWTEYNIGSGTFAIGQSPDWKPSEDGATIAFEVDDLEAVAKELKEKGVSFKLELQSFPTCSMAVIKDPDNNNVLIHQRKNK